MHYNNVLGAVMTVHAVDPGQLLLLLFTKLQDMARINSRWILDMYLTDKRTIHNAKHC